MHSTACFDERYLAPHPCRSRAVAGAGPRSGSRCQRVHDAPKASYREPTLIPSWAGTQLEWPHGLGA